MRIDTEVSEIELRKNWFFQKFKCKISFYNIWEPKMSQLIVIGSHWGFAGCSLVSQWGSLRVIWWSFGGHSGFLKKFNFEFGNKFDYLICHSVIPYSGEWWCLTIGDFQTGFIHLVYRGKSNDITNDDDMMLFKW